MTPPADSLALVDGRTLPLPLTADGHLWQERLLDARELARFAADRDIQFSDEDVEVLWRLKLLRADLVGSRSRIRLSGLDHLRKDRRGWHWYADRRTLEALKEETARPRHDDASRARNAVPLFHPFRLYVLYHLSLAIEPSVTVLASLFGLRADDKFNQDWHRGRRRWFASARFVRALERWHNVAALATVLEPVFYRRLFGVVRYSGITTLPKHQRAVERHWRMVRQHLITMPIEAIEEERRQIVFDADRLDDNPDLHLLVRLADHDLRERLRSGVGGAMVFLTMAETIRRGTERAFRKRLPEEDALSGSRSIRENAKKLLFGSTRVLDDDPAAREFLRHHNLHLGMRLRWYVEGQTEAALIRELLGRAGAPGIEVQTLHGSQFIQKNAVAFRERLRQDKRLGVFSFISIDGDEPLTLKVIKQAAVDDLICGRVFVSNPDVELGNFDRDELTTVLWGASIGTPAEMETDLAQAVQSASSGEELVNAAKNALHPHLAALSKGEAWGQLLGRFAADHPTRGATRRPVVEAVHLALAFPRQSHDWTLREYRIDPLTLLPVKRQSVRRTKARRAVTKAAPSVRPHR